MIYFQKMIHVIVDTYISYLYKDVLIVPELGDITASSFERTDKAIGIGYKAAEKKKPELMNLALPQSDYEAYLA